MSILVVVLTLALLAAVIVVVSGPLRATHTPEGAPSKAGGPGESEIRERAELDVAREAKYREIRDTELDYRTGKLSREDYEAVDGALRAEALAILDRLDALSREEPALSRREEPGPDPPK